MFAFGPEWNLRLLSNPDLFQAGKESLFRPPKGTSLERLSFNNLLQMNGEHHMQQRRLMLPAFHKKQIVSYHSDMTMLRGGNLTDSAVSFSANGLNFSPTAVGGFCTK